jgi:hypothetical protein
MGKNSSIHYNEKIRNMTIEMYMRGKSHYEIEKAIFQKIRNHRQQTRK